MRRFIIATVVLALTSVGARADPNKILYSPHGGYATIIELNGVNSDKALVRFRFELDDFVEACTRELGDDASSKTVAACVKQDASNDTSKIIYTRKAYCSRLTIYTEFGNFSMVNHQTEVSPGENGKVFRMVRTDWKNHRTGEIVENSSASNTPVMLDTLKVLCPVFYENLFKGSEPY